jgi:ZIP family zinc transporter
MWPLDHTIWATHAQTPVWAGIALGVLAAMATMIGWLMAASRKTWPVSVQAAGLIFAALAMMGLSVFEMVPDARESGLSGTSVAGLFLLGAALALATVYAARRVFDSHAALAQTAFVVALVIGLHNIPEGSIVVGVSMISLDAAMLSAVVIALQNIPEGLAVATPVIAAGGTRLRAFAFTAVATGGEIVGVLLAAQYASVMTQQRVGTLLAVVAGVMFTISVVELGPAAVRIIRHRHRAPDVAAGAGEVSDAAVP